MSHSLWYKVNRWHEYGNYHHGTTVQQVSFCVCAQRLRDYVTMKWRVSLAGLFQRNNPGAAADCIHGIVMTHSLAPGRCGNNFICITSEIMWRNTFMSTSAGKNKAKFEMGTYLKAWVFVRYHIILETIWLLCLIFKCTQLTWRSGTHRCHL